MPAWTGWPYASTARPNGGDACAALLQRRRNSPNLINLTTQIFADISEPCQGRCQSPTA